MYFIYYLRLSDPYYIKLEGNETVVDIFNKMVNNNDINVKDSSIKKFIDSWYFVNFKNTDFERYLEDTIFCNDRTVDEAGGWSENGIINISGSLKFNAYNKKYYLKCPNKRDAFTVSDIINGNGSLNYPIGLLTATEYYLIGNANAGKTGNYYWLFSPGSFFGDGLSQPVVFSDGNFASGTSDGKGVSYGLNSYEIYSNEGFIGVRPTISLKPGTKFISGGDGTASNPYEVDMNN